MGSLNTANSFLDEEDKEPEISFTLNRAVTVDYALWTTFKELSPQFQKGVLNLEKLPRPTRLQSFLVPSIAKEPNVSRSVDRDQGVGLGILLRIHQNLQYSEPQAIAISPTNEIAKEFCKRLRSLAHFTDIVCDSFAPFHHVESQLSSDVICGTFESLRTPILNNAIDISNVKVIVIDELDFIFLSKTSDERPAFVTNFFNLLSGISQRSRNSVQLIVLCSAYCDVVKGTLHEWLAPGTYNMLFGNEDEKFFGNLRHEKVIVNNISKINVVEKILQGICGTNGFSGQVIMYVKDENISDSLHENFVKWNVKTPKLAGDLKDECLSQFREGCGDILITSERLPLGYDVTQPVCVIFYDIPIMPDSQPDHSLFHHIAGRAGKANDRLGRVVTLLEAEGDLQLLERLEKNFNFEAVEIHAPDVEMNLILPQS